MTKYIFITGGVVSRLGKGVAATAIGCLLKARGLSIEETTLDFSTGMEPAEWKASGSG